MVRAYVGSFLSLAGLACALTWVYLGMRAVMDVGGACADGGPYVSAQPCPDGVPLLMVGGIFGGLICVGLFLWFASRLGGQYASLAAFAWPALFLSLGWNFFEFGFDPPGEDEGLVWGWLVCGVIFALMGGLPLLGLAKPSTVRKLLWPPDPDPLARPSGASSPVRLPARPKPVRRRPSPPPRPAAPAPAGDDDMVARLERLAALRERGALDPDEYDRAKKAVLDG